MSVLCSSHNLNQLEDLNYDLETHCYALSQLVEDVPGHYWPDMRFRLLNERICLLEQTAAALRTFEEMLRQGCDFNPDE